MKLTYLDIPARAEATRLALAIGGVDFEDDRVSFDQFQTVAKQQPFGQIPVLEVDGTVYGESDALLRYAGKVAGLYPKCEKEALRVDMVVDSLESVMGPSLKAAFAADKAAAKADVLQTTLPRYFGAIEKIYAENKGPFLLGEVITIADLKVMSIYRQLTDGGMFAVGEPKALNAYPRIQAAAKAVLAHGKVASWYKKNPMN